MKQYFTTRTGRLALTYLAIIMIMTIVFSVVIFVIASHQFDRPLPARVDMRMMNNGADALRDEFLQRAIDAKTELFASILLLNIVMFGFGVWFSMYLARLTMGPVERAMQEQSQFVSDASHELRTPLTALRSINEVILRRKKITDSEARELATKNIEEVTKLHTLTTSLLGLVHTEQAGSLTLQPVALQQAVGNAMESVVAAAQQRGITVNDLTPNLTVYTQPEPFTQVVRILLDNAVKYSHKNSTVTVSAATHGNKLVTLTITDTGVGIHKDDIPHIFSRFYRADESRSKEHHDGYGLGLAIAKAISDRFAMAIRVTSHPGKGSAFSIDVPLYQTKGVEE